MNTNDQAKRMPFYATPEDQRIIHEIQELAPHYSFNHLTREGHRMLLKLLRQSRPARPKRQVEYNVAREG